MSNFAKSLREDFIEARNRAITPYHNKPTQKGLQLSLEPMVKSGFVVVCFVAFLFWVFYTIGTWFIIHPREGLLFVLEGQWEYLKDLKIL